MLAHNINLFAICNIKEYFKTYFYLSALTSQHMTQTFYLLSGLAGNYNCCQGYTFWSLQLSCFFLLVRNCSFLWTMLGWVYFLNKFISKYSEMNYIFSYSLVSTITTVYLIYSHCCGIWTISYLFHNYS